MREFTKISWSPSKGLVLKWQTPVKGEDSEDGHIKSSLESQQTPHDGFLKALKALAPDIPEHCEMPDGWYKERIIILGVSLSHDDAGLSGASIQSQIGLHSGNTITINGPGLKVKGDAHELLKDTCVHRLRTLMKEADNVLKTAASKQTELFPAPMPQTEEPAKGATSEDADSEDADSKDADAKDAAPKSKSDQGATAKDKPPKADDQTPPAKAKSPRGGGTNGSPRKAAVPPRQAPQTTREPARAAAGR